MPLTPSARTRQMRVIAGLAAALAATAVYAATYPAWQPDTYYAAGTLVTYNGRNYRANVNQTDYASTGWNPTTTSLWTDIGASSEPAPTPPPPAPAPTPTPPPPAPAPAPPRPAAARCGAAAPPTPAARWRV